MHDRTSRAVLAFDGSGGRLSRLFLRDGFHHVSVAIETPDGWIGVDGLSDTLEVEVKATAGFDLAGFWRRCGYTVVETVVRPRAMRFIPPGLLTCVEVAKRALNIRAPLALTPYQLFRHIEEEEAAMGGLFGGSKASPQKTIPAAPVAETEEIAAKKDEDRETAARRTGRQGTILTGGLGVLGSPNIAKPTLLGQ